MLSQRIPGGGSVSFLGRKRLLCQFFHMRWIPHDTAHKHSEQRIDLQVPDTPV